jgi:gamma-glutamyl:cysteine ligase YbdK (ATP-grasp superfamily)
VNELLPGLPFSRAEYNFYRAAQHGLDAKLLWPQRGRSDYRERDASEIIVSVLPLARAGLEAIGVAHDEARHYIEIIEQRLQRRQTGAIWQRNMLAQLRERMPLQEALHELLEVYMEHSEQNLPVAEWPL